MISAIHRGFKKLLDKLKLQLEHFRINPPSLTSLAAGTLRLFVLVTLFWLAVSHFQVPDNPYIRVIQKGVILCGVLLLGFYSIRWSISDQLTHNPPNLGYGLVILTVTVSLIGNAGDYALLHPQESLPLIAIAVITLFIDRCIRPAFPAPVLTADANPVPQRAMGYSRRKASSQDRRFIAAHEAGHALIFAACLPYPDDLSVVVKESPDAASNAMGYVNKAQYEHLIVEKVFAEWHMLLSLAGNAGERASTGRETLGAVSDSSSWRAVAATYLSCLQRGMFYHPPSNKLEIEQNEAQLVRLHEEQKALLTRFFELNHDVHARLTQRLLDDGSLKGVQLHPYFEAVTFPAGFPRPSDITS
ncbi:hypothetical protein K3J15_003913 [Salmonella enterica subsp. enterica serovar Mbandaka]|nr:hypothetical protein [Salmonella enterica subsp. enterica serovar Mbandaka]